MKQYTPKRSGLGYLTEIDAEDQPSDRQVLKEIAGGFDFTGSIGRLFEKDSEVRVGGFIDVGG